jgi:hypothetical protein
MSSPLFIGVSVVSVGSPCYLRNTLCLHHTRRLDQPEEYELTRTAFGRSSEHFYLVNGDKHVIDLQFSLAAQIKKGCGYNYPLGIDRNNSLVTQTYIIPLHMVWFVLRPEKEKRETRSKQNDISQRSVHYKTTLPFQNVSKFAFLCSSDSQSDHRPNVRIHMVWH